MLGKLLFVAPTLILGAPAGTTSLHGQEPNTGAAPGERHGIMRVQSPGPEETLTLTVRHSDALRVGGPGIMAARGCFALG